MTAKSTMLSVRVFEMRGSATGIKIWRWSSLLLKIMYHLQITYVYSLMCFKSAADYLHQIQCKHTLKCCHTVWFMEYWQRKHLCSVSTYLLSFWSIFQSAVVWIYRCRLHQFRLYSALLDIVIFMCLCTKNWLMATIKSFSVLANIISICWLKWIFFL